MKYIASVLNYDISVVFEITEQEEKDNKAKELTQWYEKNFYTRILSSTDFL